MVEATFALFVASGLCLTFSTITAIHAIRTLEKSREFLLFAFELLHHENCDDEYRKEGTE